MVSKRSREAYLMIDHRNSPGISPEFLRANNLDARERLIPGVAHAKDHLRANNLDAPAVGAGVTFESAVAVCHSCGGDVILNPDRSRPRAWCMKHDAYLCDPCEALRSSGQDCVPYEQKLTELWDGISNGRPLL